MPDVVIPIFCEDIRHEVGGQYTAVGIYQNEVVATTFPFKGRIAILLVLKNYAAEPIELTLEGERGAIFAKVNVEAELIEPPPPNEPVIIPLPALAVSLSGPEIISAFAKFGDDEKVKIGTLTYSLYDPMRASHPKLG